MAVANSEETTVVALLKACARKKDLCKGIRLHAHILASGMLEKSCFVANTLVSMYANCGAFAKAQRVLEELTVHDVVAWNALIAGYAQQGHGEEALECFRRMQHEGLSPNPVTFTCVLKACGRIGAAHEGQQIHDEIIKQGLLAKDIVLGNALVDMYAKCGAVSKAHKVLNELPVRNTVSWSTLIAGYARKGQGEEALHCFEQMQREGLSPNVVTYTCVLEACSIIGAAEKGQQFHDEIVRQGLLAKNVVLGTALVNMYSKCGALDKAQQLLDELPVRDVVSWSALIAEYVQQGQGEKALGSFERMQCEGLSPDAVTFTCILKACGNTGAADKGQQIHDEIVRQGLLGSDAMLGNSLVEMYSKCGKLAKAQQVLDNLPKRSVLSWNPLVAEYAQQGLGEEVLHCYEWMKQESLSLDVVTFTWVLKACGSIGAADRGEQIHDEVVKQGILDKSVVLGTALVDMYAKCGKLARAQQVFDELPVRVVVTWSALIAGYVQQGQNEEALNCFDRMQCEGLCPDAVTFTCILKVCGSLGAAEKGEQIHGDIVRQGLLGKDTLLGAALVDMYAKCGALAKAQRLLGELPTRNVVTWNVLVAGYAQKGCGEEALVCFERMQLEGLSPNAVTLVCVLNACSHSGLLDEGQMYFASMSTQYGITPDVEHHTSMVDLFGRAGNFDKALAVIKKMSTSDYLPVWVALLGACRKWGNVKLGRLAFDHAVQVDKNDAAAYVCMASIYTAAGMKEDAENIEAMRVKHGRSQDVVGGLTQVETFTDGDAKHAQCKSIHVKLQDIARVM